MKANRKDANHNLVEIYLRSLGFVTLDISALKNCCDIVASKNGVTYLIEIKDGTKPPSQRKLTSGEKKFRDYWQSSGKWILIKSRSDCDYLDFLVLIDNVTTEQLGAINANIYKSLQSDNG